MNNNQYAFDHPDDALRALADRLAIQPIDSGANECIGRVLADPVNADRDSPAADVSAMDGYAIRMSDLKITGAIEVVGESACGQSPPPMPAQGVLRIFTGAIVPDECEAVIKREDTVESDNAIEIRSEGKVVETGANIRRSGENLAAGQSVFEPGVWISAVTQAALVNFGHYSPTVFKRVNVSVLTTGDEVISQHDSPKPWQLRNSNMHSLVAMLSNKPWLQTQSSQHCGDDRDKLATALQQSLGNSDAVILTGGVSMGDYDFVPDVITEVGGQIIFHRLPLRPGKPILGAVTREGKLIVGLPGNPVSAIVNARRMVLPLLAKKSGQTNWLPSQPKIHVEGLKSKLLPLHQMILVKINEAGHGVVVPSKGSGDLVALAHSDGFIQIPPNTADNEPRPFYRW
ncbi:Molybdopterin molybdenumtransferase [Rubripirellula obstinata]|uniref:Molybdopterin molybdenumtransferase n=1 Tax=Rubripirellula obstinata TaxID=406547 RepID=A0A5B1CLC8_9BACT|nr:molybdopterin molybdotransferase MoeA [Rubripirellula obstinata]KAA1260685.1 Molybdopterin molybdenumtransferase [Rubripirellula obstinata]